MAEIRKRWPELRTLVVVHSRPSQADFRAVVRQTWGDAQAYGAVRLRPLFFLGRSPDPEGGGKGAKFKCIFPSRPSSRNI